MSNLIILSLLSFGLVTSFSFIYSAKKELKFIEYSEILGSENLSSKILEVGEFHSIEVSDQIKVIINQGSANVEVSAEDNLLEYIKVDNNDGTLRIYRHFDPSQNIQQNLPMIVKVSNLKFDKLYGSNQSEIIIEDKLVQASCNIELRDQSNFNGSFSSTDINLRTSQQSNATLFGTVEKLTLNITDQSGVKSNNLTANEVDIVMRNQASARVHAAMSIKGRIDGNSDLNVDGNPPINEVVESGMAKAN